MGNTQILTAMYETMNRTLEPNNWWQGRTPFEIAVGIILLQNTQCEKAEQALENLKQADSLTPSAILSKTLTEVDSLIHPAGHARSKSRRLHNLAIFLKENEDVEMEHLKAQGIDEVRSNILSINGIGLETADALLLYSLGFPLFAINASMYRIALRHGLAYDEMDYHELQALFMDALPKDVALYKQFHGLLSHVGRKWCTRSKTRCSECPLQPLLEA